MIVPFDTLLLYIKSCIAVIGAFVITVGAVHSLYQLFMLVFFKKFDVNYIRLQFGNSMILGLEFMVAADLIGSLIKPNYYNLGLLALLVLIRTVLSFFLNRELAWLAPEKQHHLK